MRTIASPIRLTTGCSASTARGTCTSCAISTPTAPSSPAIAQAKVSRCTSPKPEKRHMPLGTFSAANTATYSTSSPASTQPS